MNSTALSGTIPEGKRLTQKQRLLTTKDFEKVFDRKERYVGKYMVIWIGDKKTDVCRAGVIASRKIGKAVKRNRAKRLLREAFRCNQHDFLGTRDIIIIARREILNATLESIEQEMRWLCTQAGIRSA